MKKEQYRASADTVTLLVKNNSQTDFLTGEYLFLKKKVEGMWYQFPYSRDHFTEAGVGHKPGGTSSMSSSIKELKDDLTPGKYRAVLQGLAAPFEIVKP